MCLVNSLLSTNIAFDKIESKVPFNSYSVTTYVVNVDQVSLTNCLISGAKGGTLQVGSTKRV